MEKSVTSIIEALKLNAQKTPDKLCVGDKKNHATYGAVSYTHLDVYKRQLLHRYLSR